ncbi:MAG TPA: hypothetical protein VGL61_33500 [Kofleriaceae bacterium]|nr:hypothetical protein [Polyangiaceae bacterium]
MLGAFAEEAGVVTSARFPSPRDDCRCHTSPPAIRSAAPSATTLLVFIAKNTFLAAKEAAVAVRIVAAETATITAAVKPLPGPS